MAAFDWKFGLPMAIGSDRSWYSDNSLCKENDVTTQDQGDEKKFKVMVKRISEEKAHAEAHGQRLELAIEGGNAELGFTAPKTSHPAFAACILSNVNKQATTLGIEINEARVEFDVTKRLDPLGFEPMKYNLLLHSSAPVDKLNTLVERATTDGTATNTMLEGFNAKGSLQVVRLGVSK